MSADQKRNELARIKREMVAAHIADDGERLRELSAEKQAWKKKNFCVDCGLPCRGFRCMGHNIINRFYARRIAASLALLFLVAGCSTQRPLPTIDLPEGTKLILPSLMEAENIRTIFPVDSEHYSKIVELPRGYQLTPQRNERH